MNNLWDELVKGFGWVAGTTIVSERKETGTRSTKLRPLAAEPVHSPITRSDRWRLAHSARDAKGGDAEILRVLLG